MCVVQRLYDLFRMRRAGRETRRYSRILMAAAFFWAFAAAEGQQSDRCAKLKALKLSGVEITKTELVTAGRIIPPAYPGAASIGPLPAHCRVDGIINQRKGVNGEEFGIGFAVALPEKEAWNGDFMFLTRASSCPKHHFRISAVSRHSETI